MATENYIRDLSNYLMAGNLSDLTLKFGEKSWQIHKALACCHSKWFQKAVTIGFKETDSGVITLNDDPEFADAIHCMVSYFYKANYRPSEYDTSESLLHAQVAIMADKYDCASLFELARSSFANAVKGVEIEDWIAIATLIYEHMPTDLESHVEFRGLVISAVVERPDALSEFLEKDSIVGLLRSNADMATDLLLASPKTEFSQYIFTCTDCGYMHVGPRNCSYVESNDGPVGKRPCPRCGQYSGGTSEVCFDDTDSFEAFPCSCGGFQNQKPEYKFPWEVWAAEAM